MSGVAAPPQQRRALLAWASVYFAWLVGAWVLAWIAWTWAQQHAAWLDTDLASFAYWTSLKIVVWAAPALWLIRMSSRSLGNALGGDRLGATLSWGFGAGLVLVLLNVAVRQGFMTPPFTWALVNAAVVAPVVEELAFRGAVLGALTTRLPFALANTITAALFVLIHVPGWWFQGRLLDMLSMPIGGALSIFVLGWLFGWIAYKSRSIGAAIIAHALNNLTTFG